MFLWNSPTYIIVNFLINLFKKKLVELGAPIPFEKNMQFLNARPVYLEEQEQWLKKNTMYNQAAGLCFVLKKVFDPIAKQLTPIVPFWRVKFDNEEKNEGIFKGNLVHVVKCGLTHFSKELRHKRGLTLKCLRRNHEQI